VSVYWQPLKRVMLAICVVAQEGSPGRSMGGGAGGAARHRWARSAVLRHVAATLHVLPEAAVGAAGGGGDGSLPAQEPIRCLRAVLSRALPSGEDGAALRTW
jgi:hypothetical protein